MRIVLNNCKLVTHQHHVYSAVLPLNVIIESLYFLETARKIDKQTQMSLVVRKCSIARSDRFLNFS